MTIEENINNEEEIPWYIRMRKKLSLPESILKDGTFNADYFQPKTENEEEWSDIQDKILINNIKEFGLGKWSEIKRKDLGKWSENEIRLQASVLLKAQRFEDYYPINWKPKTDEEINIMILKVEKESKENGFWNEDLGLATDSRFDPQIQKKDNNKEEEEKAVTTAA